MTCLLTDGSVFFHIPKTGGTWVYKILESKKLVKSRLGHVHADYLHAYWNNAFHPPLKFLKIALKNSLSLKTENSKMSECPRSFCFVREPLSWYESYWKYMQQLGWPTWGDESDPRNWHPCAYLNGTGSDDFNSFVKAVLKKRPGFVSEMFGWYAHPSVTFIGHQESLAEDLSSVLSNFGILAASDLEKKQKENISDPLNSDISWDPLLARDLVQVEAPSYRRFDYAESKALERAGA